VRQGDRLILAEWLDSVGAGALTAMPLNARQHEESSDRRAVLVRRGIAIALRFGLVSAIALAALFSGSAGGSLRLRDNPARAIDSLTMLAGSIWRCRR
jgi:cation:H+ antiporter